MTQTTAAHQKIWCRHPAERRSVGQKPSSQRSVCRSPTSLKLIIAEYAEVAFLQLSLYLHPTLVRCSIACCERLSMERLAPVIQDSTVELIHQPEGGERARIIAATVAARLHRCDRIAVGLLQCMSQLTQRGIRWKRGNKPLSGSS